MEQGASKKVPELGLVLASVFLEGQLVYIADLDLPVHAGADQDSVEIVDVQTLHCAAVLAMTFRV